MTVRLTLRGPGADPNSDLKVRNGPDAGRADLWIHPRTACLLAFVAALPFCVVSAAFLDVPVARFAAMLPPNMRAVAQRFSDLGLSGYMLVLSGFLAVVSHYLVQPGRSQDSNRPLALLRERAFFVFATIAVSGILVQILKHLIGRARPKLLDTLGATHFDFFSIKASLASFPSGHATSVFALATALSLMLPHLRVPAFALALLVATARIALGAHFLSDVVAGGLLGVVVALVLADVFANRSIAFVREQGRLCLKGKGSIGPMLRALVFRSRMSA